MEFKNGRMRVSGVAEQLRAGAPGRRAACFPKGIRSPFSPVAVVYESVNKKQRRDLKEERNWVRYRGRCEPVRVLRCGDLLTDMLGS